MIFSLHQQGNVFIIMKKGREAMFKGKKVLCIGERDGVPGSAIAECIKTAGGEPVLQLTQCFV